MQMFATEPASQFSILEEELYAKQYAGLSHFLDVIPWCGEEQLQFGMGRGLY